MQIYKNTLMPYMGLMNDSLRNQFYDKSLKEVTGLRCLEIGFGPGLLSFIALRHHPKHIVAFEQHRMVYELGKYLIKKTGVEDRITLINEHVDQSDITPREFDVVFHEVLGDGLWDEGIGVFSYLNTPVPFIPSSYVCDFYVCEISNEEFLKLSNRQKSRPDNPKFLAWYEDVKDPSWRELFELDDFDSLPDWIKSECKNKFGFVKENFEFNMPTIDFGPGVDVNADYVNEINNILQPVYLNNNDQITNKITINEKKYLPRCKKVMSIELDQYSKKVVTTNHHGQTNITEIDFAQSFIDITIEKSALPSTCLVIPIFSIKHRDSILVLSEGHWGQCGDNAVVKLDRNIIVRQHFNYNGIEYF